jgi:hypothetical protein
MPLRALLSAALAALLGSLAACGDDVHSIDATREVEPRRSLAEVPSDQRFGFQGMPTARSGGAPSEPEFSWHVPGGWTELPAKSPRAGSFAAPGGVDISLTSLPGMAGGVGPNVNRWRSQMGLQPWSDEEIAALPTASMLGGEAVLVDFAGVYSGMGDGPTTEGARLVGYILTESARTVFVKMVGPSSAVDAQLDAVAEYVASLQAGAHDHAAHAGGASGGGPMALSDAKTDPHAGPHANVMGAGPGGSNPLGLQWVAPEGWTRGAERPLRVVSYSPEGSPDVECYVVVLGGTGGGVVQNINLWRSQMGLAPLDMNASLDAGKLEVLGQDSPLVDLTGTGNAEGRGMLGLVCPLPTHTVFVKMTGPADDVQSAKADFLAFCRSLEL